MRRIQASWAHRHRVLVAVLALAALVAVAYSARLAGEWVVWWRWTAQADRVTAVSPAAPSVATATVSFRYRGRTRFLTIPVSAEELTADAAVQTDFIFATRPALRQAYLARLLQAQSRAPSVAAVARQLRQVRDALGLDADEYVELMSAAVQDLPYGTPAPAFPMPAQMLLAGRGVCVDKSLLLGALLLHEGYDAGLWAVPAKDHVAVAVRGLGEGFARSGYAFIETTERTYVGQVPSEFASLDPMQPKPLLVRAGGLRRYQADVQTAIIVDELERAEQKAGGLAAYRGYAVQAEGRWRELYATAVEQKARAAALVTNLVLSSDDRAVAFAALESLNWGHSSRPC